MERAPLAELLRVEICSMTRSPSRSGDCFVSVSWHFALRDGAAPRVASG